MRAFVYRLSLALLALALIAASKGRMEFAPSATASFAHFHHCAPFTGDHSHGLPFHDEGDGGDCSQCELCYAAEGLLPVSISFVGVPWLLTERRNAVPASVTRAPQTVAGANRARAPPVFA